MGAVVVSVIAIIVVVGMVSCMIIAAKTSEDPIEVVVVGGLVFCLVLLVLIPGVLISFG